MAERAQHGALTRRLGRELRALVERSGRSDLEVFYDHGEAGESPYAIPHFGEYDNGTTLANVDVAVVKAGRVVLLCEVEEHGARPKHIIGDIDNIFVATGIRIDGKPYPFHGAVFVQGVLVEKDGRGKDKAEALCELVPSIVSSEARKGIDVIPVLESNQDDFVNSLKREICRQIGLKPAVDDAQRPLITGDHMADLFAALRSMDVRPEHLADRLQLIMGHLETAVSDIRASAALHEKGLYALSTYHLQQATEKLTKSYILFTNLMSPEEVRRIGHDPLLGFIRLAQKMRQVSEVMAHYTGSPKMDLDGLIALNEDGGLEIAKLSAESISAIIGFMDLFNPTSSLMAGVFSSIEDEDIGSMAREAADELDVEEDEVEKLLEDAERMDAIKNDVLSVTLELVPLYLLSGITFPHEAFTRYCDGPMKPTEYTTELGIVSATPELLERLDMAAENLRSMIEEQNRSEGNS